MPACIRSTLILVALFAVMASPAMGEDISPMSPAGQILEPALPTLPEVAEPGGSVGIEDEEAPPADAPVDEPFSMTGQQSAGGPKSSTDKIVDKFMLLDTNASKAVSMQEYLIMVQQRVQKRFDAMDANRDGEVSEDEYRTFWKSRMARWYRLQR